jgi:hypothetical protein
MGWFGVSEKWWGNPQIGFFLKKKSLGFLSLIIGFWDTLFSNKPIYVRLVL